MRTYHRLAFSDCTAFSAAVESPHYRSAVQASLARGEVIEVQGHRFQLCRSGSDWKIKPASLWQMTHRQRFARLMRRLHLGGDAVLWEARVRHFVKHCTLRVVSGVDGLRVQPLYALKWMPPPLDGSGMSMASREAGRQRRAELLRYSRPPADANDGAAERNGKIPPCAPKVLPKEIDLRRLCPDVAADLFGPRANLSERNLRDSDLGPLDLHGANLRGAVLIRCRAPNVNLSDADLRGADLRQADLSGARLAGAGLVDTMLAGAKLRNATLDGADLRNQKLNLMALAGATLHGANLTGASLELPDDALTDGATRRAVLKPLGHPDGNLLRTVASMPELSQRREALAAIVRALNRATADGEDVCDTHDAFAQLLLKNLDDYWGAPSDISADIALNGWIQTLARHQCTRLAYATPVHSQGVVLQLADRYRAIFAERGVPNWQVSLDFGSPLVSQA